MLLIFLELSQIPIIFQHWLCAPSGCKVSSFAFQAATNCLCRKNISNDPWQFKDGIVSTYHFLYPGKERFLMTFYSQQLLIVLFYIFLQIQSARQPGRGNTPPSLFWQQIIEGLQGMLKTLEEYHVCDLIS